MKALKYNSKKFGVRANLALWYLSITKNDANFSEKMENFNPTSKWEEICKKVGKYQTIANATKMRQSASFGNRTLGSGRATIYYQIYATA